MQITNSTNCIGWVGESSFRYLYFQIEEDLQQYLRYVDFELADGTKYTVGPIQSTTQLLLDEYLLAQAGELKAQLVLKSNNNVVAKSPVRLFRVYRSISATENLREYVDEQDAKVLNDAKEYTDNELDEVIDLVKSSVSITYLTGISLSQPKPIIYTLDDTYKHFIYVTSVNSVDDIVLTTHNVQHELIISDTKVKLDVYNAFLETVNLVLLDFIISDDATTTGFLKYNDSSEQNVLGQYDTTKSYKYGEMFTYTDNITYVNAVFMTKIAHSPEGFTLSHNVRLDASSSETKLYEYTFKCFSSSTPVGNPFALFKFITKDDLSSYSTSELLRYLMNTVYISSVESGLHGVYQATASSALQSCVMYVETVSGTRTIKVFLGNSTLVNMQAIGISTIRQLN